jgi:hypothetical protein
MNTDPNYLSTMKTYSTPAANRLSRTPAIRRNFPLLVLAALAVWFLGLGSTAGAAEERPNILFLFADDWGWPHASCLGAAEVQTPTFDRLAKEGVLFRSAYVVAPSCSPSRAGILTGQWPWRLEQGANLH